MIMMMIMMLLLRISPEEVAEEVVLSSDHESADPTRSRTSACRYIEDILRTKLCP